MNENIDESLAPLVVNIEDLVPLEGNPRRGNIDAITASYREFGQLRPIVVTPNEDGTMTVIAGNHQVEAAKRLGWKKIAAVKYDAPTKKAVAFALADNRTNELGYTHPSLLQDMIVDVTEVVPELFENLGWDVFELASLHEQAARHDRETSRIEAGESSGYIAPVIVDTTASPLVNATPNIAIEVGDQGNKIVPQGTVDSKSVAATGSTSIGASGSNKAVVQYTLVFDDSDQQRRWYEFVRWLRLDPGYDGETTAQRLMNFVESHANF